MSTEIVFREHEHYDKNLEKAVLGACLLESAAFGKIQGILARRCFYLEAHAVIWEVISDLWKGNQPIDILTVVAYSARAKISLPDGTMLPYFITQLTNAVVSSAHIEHHAMLVREMYINRELEKLTRRSNGKGKDALAKITNLQEELAQLVNIRTNYDWSNMQENVIELIRHMENVKDRELIGVPLGYEELDLMTGGQVPGTVTVIAARPSVGKSAFLNRSAIYQAAQNIRVGIITLEMPKVQVTARMASLVSQESFFKIYRNHFQDEEERNRMHQHLVCLSELPIHISDRVAVNVHDIKAKAAQLIYKKELEILYIDYLQLIESPDTNKNSNREQEVAKISRALKIIAMDFHIPIVLLAQLNRETEKNEGKKPQLHNLRESGSIEQDADMVLFLHRDWKVGITADKDGKSTEFEADIIVAKARNGELKSYKIGWQPAQMRFFDPLKQPLSASDFDFPSSGRVLWKPIAD